MPEIGSYILPVIASFEGIDSKVNKQLGDKLGVVAKKSGKDFGKQLGEGISGSAAEVNKAIDVYRKAFDKAADSADKLKVAQASLKDLQEKNITSGPRYERALAAQNKAMRDQRRAVDEAKNSYRDYEDTARRAGSGVDDFNTRSGGLRGTLSSVGSSLAAFGPQLAAIGGVAIAGAAVAGLVEVGRALYDVGAQFDDMSDTIAVKTGATGDELAGLEGIAKNLARSVPLPFADLGDVVAETNRNLHLTGPELENVSKTLANLNRITGEQTDLRGLGKAFRAFGVDAKDQVSALDALYTASTNSGLSVNDLIGSVTKGGPALRQFGFDFGESAALITTFEEAGVDSEKTLATLNKAFATFSKEGVDAQTGLQNTVTEMQRLISIGDETGAADLSNKVFGARGGVNFFELVKTGAIDLQSLSNTLSGTGTSINAMAENTDDAAEKWQLLKNRIMEAAEPLATGLFNMAGTGLDDLTAWVDANQPKIISLFTTLVTVSLDTLAAIGKFSSGGLRFLGMFADSSAGLIGKVVATLGTGTREIGQLVAQIPGMDSIGEKLIMAGGKAELTGTMLQHLGDEARIMADQIDQGVGVLASASNMVRDLGGNAEAASQRAQQLANTISALPGSKDININAVVVFKDTSGLVIPPDQLRTPTFTPAVPGESRPRGGGRASGGPITGPGGPKSDVIPIWASNGEHMWTAAEVNAVGGQASMYRLRAAAMAGAFKGFAEGGAIESGINFAASAGDGRAYVYGGTGPGYDCSGYMSAIYAAFTGKPTTQRYFTTESDFEALGFVKGSMPGAFNIGVRRGGGGRLSHMAGTLPNGVNVESGGSHNSTLYGGAAAGADAFPLKFYLPVGGGDPADAATSSTGTSGSVPSVSGGSSGGSSGGGLGGAIGALTGGGGGGGGGLGQFGEIGSIASSFIKETFGLDGSFLPDISQLGVVQMGSNLLNAFKGPLQGLMEGKLGIQQPGWSPGMPVNGVAAPSLSPFGMSATQMPGIEGVSSGVGTGALPGPVSIDNSTTINSPTGDPNDIENRIRRTNMNRPRIDSYALPGT